MGGLCVAVLNHFQIADQSLRPRDARSRQTRNPNAFRVEHKSSVTREAGTCAVYNTLNKKNLLTLDAICVCVCVCVRHGLINLEARNRHRPALRLPHELHESGAALFRLLIIASSSAVDMSGETHA
jgi:hypothetical protein